MVSFSFAKQHGVLLREDAGEQSLVIYHDTITSDTLIELQRLLTHPFQLKQVSTEEFDTLLTHHYGNTQSTIDMMASLEDNIDLQSLISAIPKTKDLLETDDNAPIIQLINALFSQALKQSASDIHFETFEDKFLIRFRIDGILHEVLQPPHVLAPLIISRLKVLAKLDIAEKRLPQDGRIAILMAGRSIDVRISTIPTYYGERVVLRLLDKQSAPLNLKKLGLEQTHRDIITRLINQPNGIILVTGPTGSGKTTTLYAILTELNDEKRNILTVEDPIEYYLPGIGQTQVNTKVNMTFARGLRAILRQDPDVVMVGEIRDIETAEMSIQASLTGHLVLSTLHTNSAIGAITRLRDMGTEPFLLASTLNGIIAQRLVRVLCVHCKIEKPLEPKQRELMELPPEDTHTALFHAVGCEHCRHTGYLGRTGIYEVIEVDEALRRNIHDNANEADMLTHVRQYAQSIRTDGWHTVLAGKTTIEEILRVT